jgi:hypothetical protein
MNMQHGHGNATWICPCSMDVDMQHGHGHEAWTGTWTCSMHMSLLHIHVHAACPSTCCVSMYSTVHVNADIQVQAARTWECTVYPVHAVSMSMLHVPVFAERPCSCCMPMYMLQSMSTLHGRSVDMDMQHRHMACSMDMDTRYVFGHTARTWTRSNYLDMQRGFLF